MPQSGLLLALSALCGARRHPEPRPRRSQHLRGRRGGSEFACRPAQPELSRCDALVVSPLHPGHLSLELATELFVLVDHVRIASEARFEVFGAKALPPNRLSAILRNQYYAGKVVVDGKVYDGRHPPLG